MYINKRDYENALETVRFNLGKAMGLENDSDCHVTLYEPTTADAMSLRQSTKSGDDKDIIRKFIEILPKYIKEHDFYEDEGVLMTNEEVINLIFRKAGTCLAFLDEYQKKVFGFPQSKTEEN